MLAAVSPASVSGPWAADLRLPPERGSAFPEF